ncbi:type II toxin-antitoxin system SpoIISA family toxin [Paenisporosarcina sp. TG20]|uniref:type II toxin-antitoxin system SpoIISA family toxin n=1 Tax=Paenisporosarcina sp. TG20 TaxID=1211706 RepID=UPI00030B30B8|nr:type II toxin-antitoxin system SpoIISA family toxin [Paenisporosarcina sp. TG20]
MSTLYIVLIGVVLVFLVASLIYYFANTDHYMDNLQSIRKSYYITALLVIGVGLIIGDFKVIIDWKSLSLIGIAMIFIDLSVLSTPDISKIGKTEFQGSLYVRNAIKKNQELIDASANKVKKFTEVISKTADYFEPLNQPINSDKYKEEMRKYLNLYADTFQSNVSIFDLDITNDSEEELENVEKAFRNAEICYNKHIEDAEWRSELIQNLLKGVAVKFVNKDEKDLSPKTKESLKKVFIVAYFGESYNMLIGIHSDFVPLNAVDASHILSLAQIFDWYMV